MPSQANFIAERYAARRRAWRLAAGLRRANVVVLLLLTLVPLLLERAASVGAWRLLQARLDRGRIADQAAETRRLQTELRDLAEPRRRAMGVHGNNAQWRDLLHELRDRLPEGLWLTRLEVEAVGDDGRQVLRLEGRAERQQAIGELVQRLNQSPWCGVAVLQRSRPADAASGAGPLEFTVTGLVRRPLRDFAGDPR
ncbi:MAG: PilN domain-containing protein [Fimbriimonadaceae bacterium]|nr:PilN domain-containing protein [Fimbriimonadaceae bacterium]